VPNGVRTTADWPEPPDATIDAGTAGEMVSGRLLVVVAFVGVVESVTVTATVLVPAAVGVPVIAPVVAPIVRPAGSPVADQLRVPFPPVAANEKL
jgi:hypothetical protein